MTTTTTKSVASSLVAILSATVLSNTVHAATYSVNLNSGSSALAAGDVAGLPLYAQPNYNNVSGNGPQNGIVLKDETGSTTAGVTLNFTGTDLWNSGIGTGTANQRLFQSYLDSTDNGINTFTLNNLATGLYNVVIYTLPDSLDGRDQSYTANGSTLFVSSGAGAAFNTNGFVRATATTQDGAGAVGNYVQFDNIPVTAGTPLTFSGTARNFRTFQNGFQVIQVPEPGTFASLLVGAGLLLGLARRR